MKTILYLSDLYYQAKGRKYYEEDLFITSRLKEYFNILIGHPQQAISFIDCADVIVFRNTGPVIYYQDYFNRFVEVVKDKNITTFNSFDGKADMKGKQYLLNLWRENYPVIPTIERVDEITKLGSTDKYIIKLKNGADSIGMKVMTRKELWDFQPSDTLIQPLLDFEYEVSFYYLNAEFQYALYAPDKQRRWELKTYQPSSSDLQFAEEFIKWNNMKHGISRVDACRVKDGSLLLVELEDLNPFLSLDLISQEKREKFVMDFIAALKNC